MPHYLHSPHARSIAETLTRRGLRPTKQRLFLSRFLFSGDGDRHVTAEQLHNEATQHGYIVSLATVYNTLNQFVEAGLLSEVIIDRHSTYFDTNTTLHHHFLCEDTGTLIDIPAEMVTLKSLPPLPQGYEMTQTHFLFKMQLG